MLDEPTTGLHFADIDRLLTSLNGLAEKDHFLIVIKYNLDVIKIADYVIDLAPEGRTQRMPLIVTGTPEQVAKSKTSYTGSFLKPYLN